MACLSLFLCSFSNEIKAQKIDNMASYRDIKSDRYFRFNYDNDFFTAKDRNYTQGYNFEFVSPFFSKNPINYLFYKPKAWRSESNEQASLSKKYGLSWEHIGFTPANIRSPDIQYGDRPFASALMLKSFLIQIDSKKKARLTSALSFGMIGPFAFGEGMQVKIHEWTGNVIPQGWPNQIQNHLIANYEVGYERQLLNANDRFSLQARGIARLGTLFTDLAIGGNFRAGLLNSTYELFDKDELQLYLYGEPMLQFVGHDASLQGSVLPEKKSPYVISSSDISRLRAALNYGVVLQLKGVYFEYSQAFQTKEFNGAQSFRWGGIKAGFVF